MRRGDEQVLDVVVLLQVHPHHADAAAALLAVGGDRQPLDVAGARDRDHHVLFRDQVLELELALGRRRSRCGGRRRGRRSCLISSSSSRIDAVDPRLVAEDRAQLGDPLLQVGVLVLDLLALEPGQRARGACRGSPGPGSRESSNCSIRPLRAASVSSERADQRDHRVEVVERDQVALEDVRALLGLAQLELRAAGDDLALVVEVVARAARAARACAARRRRARRRCSRRSSAAACACRACSARPAGSRRA